MMTDNEIIQILQHHQDLLCTDCPLQGTYSSCLSKICTEALDLILRLQGENKADESLTYGVINEFKNGTTLWYEPITDEIDGFVLRDGDGSIVRTWK